MIKQNIQTLLDGEMDRKKSLAFSGTIILGIIGITGLTNLIFKSHGAPQMVALSNQHPIQTSGYGGSTYGAN